MSDFGTEILKEKEVEVRKPEYRFQCLIVDIETGETICRASTYISSHIGPLGECESVDMEVSSMMRHFNQKLRPNYEEEYYPNEE